MNVDCLAAGEEWPQQQHAMMAYAHAGLLLFHPRGDEPSRLDPQGGVHPYLTAVADPIFKVFTAA